MRTVLLAGAFGQSNPGDEALLSAFRRQLGNCSIIATSSDPDDTARTHGCATVRSSDISEIAYHTSHVDAVVFAGGTVFKLLGPTTGRAPHDLLRKALVLAAGARLLGKPVCMLGVGAGRLDGGVASLLTRALVQRADLLVLRDEESADLLQRARVRPPFRIGSDPAWTLFDAPETHTDPDGDVYVAISHHGDGPRVIDRLVEMLRPLVEDGRTLVVQPWQGQDGQLTEDLARRLPCEISPAERDLDAVRDRYTGASLVVAMRFHAALAAAAAGARFVTYGHEAKLVAIARRLGQRCVLPSASTTGVATGALAGDGPSRDAIAGEIRSALSGFELLRLLVDGPDAADPEHVAGLSLSPRPAGYGRRR